MIAIITAAVIVVAVVVIEFMCIRCGDCDDEFNRTKERLTKVEKGSDIPTKAEAAGAYKNSYLNESED